MVTPCGAFPQSQILALTVSGITPGFPGLSQSFGQVAHVLLTRLPLTPLAGRPLDLHV